MPRFIKLLACFFAALWLSAGFAQDAELTELADRLLNPWPDPSGATMTLLAGRLPDNLPLVLPLPEALDLLGTQVWRGADGGLQSLQLIADSPLSTDETWRGLAEAFQAKGWEVRLDPSPVGFVPQESYLSGLFCAPVGTAHAYVNVNPREDLPTDLRLNLTLDAPETPCSYDGGAMYGEATAPLPTLYAPGGVDITVHASPVYINQGSSAAVLWTDRSEKDLVDHYRAQLEAAGWTEETDEVGSRWRYTDENGIDWLGVLGIATLPNGSYFATLGVVVASRG